MEFEIYINKNNKSFNYKVSYVQFPIFGTEFLVHQPSEYFFLVLLPLYIP